MCIRSQPRREEDGGRPRTVRHTASLSLSLCSLACPPGLAGGSELWGRLVFLSQGRRASPAAFLRGERESEHTHDAAHGEAPTVCGASLWRSIIPCCYRGVALCTLSRPTTLSPRVAVVWHSVEYSLLQPWILLVRVLASEKNATGLRAESEPTQGLPAHPSACGGSLQSSTAERSRDSAAMAQRDPALSPCVPEWGAAREGEPLRRCGRRGPTRLCPGLVLGALSPCHRCHTVVL